LREQLNSIGFKRPSAFEIFHVMESNYVRITSALADARFDSRNELNVQTGSVGSTNSPIRWVESSPPPNLRIKRMEHEGDHSRLPFMAQVNKKYYVYTSTPRRLTQACAFPSYDVASALRMHLPINACSPSQAPSQCHDLKNPDVSHKRR
jgi:hypothetical protein